MLKTRFKFIFLLMICYLSSINAQELNIGMSLSNKASLIQMSSNHRLLENPEIKPIDALLGSIMDKRRSYFYSSLEAINSANLPSATSEISVFLPIGAYVSLAILETSQSGCEDSQRVALAISNKNDISNQDQVVVIAYSLKEKNFKVVTVKKWKNSLYCPEKINAQIKFYHLNKLIQ